MIKIIVKKEDNILKYLTEFEGLGFNKIQALFRNKNVKVNNKKVKDNERVFLGDEILLYCKDNYFYNIKTIFEDENIIIVNKPKKIEVISQTKNISLVNLINPNYFCVHRLDFNTEGLVILAKNLLAKEELENAFKTSKINKEYITICKNIPLKTNLTFNDYLVKKDNIVKIYSTKIPNSKQVITQIELIKSNKNFSLLNIKLLTGRTHQIRAHLAFHKLYVLGDEKYGDFKINKALKLNSQILRCVKLSFNSLNESLSYLNNKIFELEFEDIKEYFDNL